MSDASKKQSDAHHSGNTSTAGGGSSSYGHVPGAPSLDLGHGKGVNARAQARIPKPVLGWKKGNGAFSAKAKKEYLRWKKQQRQLGSDDSEEEAAAVTASLQPERPPLGLPLGEDMETAGEDVQPGAVAEQGEGAIGGGLPRQVQQPPQQQRITPVKISAAAAASAAEAAKTMAELKGQPVPGGGAGSKKYKQYKAAPNEAPLEYFELEELPEGDVPEGGYTPFRNSVNVGMGSGRVKHLLGGIMLNQPLRADRAWLGKMH